MRRIETAGALFAAQTAEVPTVAVITVDIAFAVAIANPDVTVTAQALLKNRYASRAIAAELVSGMRRPLQRHLDGAVEPHFHSCRAAGVRRTNITGLRTPSDCGIGEP